MKNHKAIEVARLFLYWANQEGEVITNLKMQKLLYYAQAWHLVNFHKPLFTDKIEAWKLGPVVQQVYQKFKVHGPRPIAYQDHKGAEESIFERKSLDFLKEFYGIYIKVPAHDLVNMSHSERPWISAFKRNESIDLNTMEDFYTKQYKTSRHS